MKITAIKSLIAVVAFGAVALYFSFQPQILDKPEDRTETAAAGARDEKKAEAFKCEGSNPLTVAYRVHAEVESELNQQMIYQSRLDFRLQLQQVSGVQIYGAATDAVISQATVGHDIGKPSSVEDVLFIAGVMTGERMVFTEFNDLALIKQHPMAILSQLLKNLSVGDVGKTYRFGYDQLEREYRYNLSKENNREMRRELLSSKYTTSPSQKLQPQWDASLDEMCLPKTMQAQEVLPIASADQAGLLRFVMRAERIDNYLDLSNLNYTAQANQNNPWNVATIQTSDFAPKVTSEEEMWKIFQSFSQTRNTASLTRAAEYMMEHVEADDLANAMAEGELADDVTRDMIFALSRTSQAEAEDYMLWMLESLPVNHDKSTDLQKVRLMVAISGNDQVTDKAYSKLASMANDDGESANVRRNALINMGSMVRQMQAQGGDASAISTSLDGEIVSRMQDNDSSSAIFSAGNAGLENLSEEVANAVVAKLQSTNQKERYASARVLSVENSYYDTLIDHLANESSALVGTAIVSGLRKEELTGEQLSRLREISLTASAPEQVRYEIKKLLGS
jgi:hypothetical protein